MKLGVVLPTFTVSHHEAIRVALEAEEVGIDGVFAYDHLWPIGHPELPSMSVFPLLGVVAAVTRRVMIGPLVARVTLYREAGGPAMPDSRPDMACEQVELLLAAFGSLAVIAPGRVIAGIGAGDPANADEDLAYGLPEPTFQERMSLLEAAAERLRVSGFPVWLGAGADAGRSGRYLELAGRLGAAVNIWGDSWIDGGVNVRPGTGGSAACGIGGPAESPRRPEEGGGSLDRGRWHTGATRGPVEFTWAGHPEGRDIPALRRLIDRLREGGFSWAVVAGVSALDVAAAASPPA